ncbi:type IV secretory system conjugative DNA transfer family protein [Gluconobacter kondonii]|uniref:type IV secretory system conjugative DNA transfer family protein n=1 Tax=Gluconobacter kondonii TaxID=941463 RepID=UPI001B8B24FB|nr:TraM recognition domain-containing protein [Gluconobacter kondonii]MBS1054752.1 TraM recognition domain-containing protein [Gluconobacter kondonii]
MFEQAPPPPSLFAQAHGYIATGGFTIVAILVLVALVCVVPSLYAPARRLLTWPFRMFRKSWDATINFLVPRFVTSKIDDITPESLEAYLQRHTAGSKSSLLKGDKEATCRELFAPSKFPFLYQEVPADVRRPVTWDGRLVNGMPVSWLSWRHMTADKLAPIVRNGLRNAVRLCAGIAVTLLILNVVRIVAMTVLMLNSGIGTDVPYPDWAVGHHHVLPFVEYYFGALLQVAGSSVIAVVMCILAPALLVPAVGLFNVIRDSRTYFNKASAPFSAPSRDSLVVWKHRADVRETEIAGYIRQVEMALANSNQPVITVGSASGAARARGNMRSPSQHQPVALDGISIRQHVIAFGGTGEGKTELFLKPVFEKTISAKWGDGLSMGAYITDGKGVLYKDILAMPSVQARGDIAVLGTEEGHYGVNLVSGMTPLEVSTMLNTVSRQVMGESDDIFWSEQASIVFYHAAVVADALSRTGGYDETKWSAFAPWSLMGIHRLATNPKAFNEACDELVQLSERDDLHPEIQELLESDSVSISVDYAKTTWRQMADETRSSVIANVNSVLGKFAGAPDVMKRFCTGREERTLDVDYALNGGILGVAVGETDFGVVGQVVAVWLKTRLYIAARKRQKADPQSARTKSCLLLADEFQMLATKGGSESDAEFFNIARSTGVFMIAATQSVLSIEKRLGKTVTHDLLNNLRTKILLRTEELETLEYFSELAGETFRGIVVDDDFYETQGQREIELPDVPVEPELPPSHLRNLAIAWPGLSAPHMRLAARLDPRFILRERTTNGISNDDAVTASIKDAYWRQEDKEREIRQAGLEYRPLFTSSDAQVGHGFALAIVQRAGQSHIDIIDLQNAA